ncbi:MAG: alkaline phosphatase family protein [Thermodesulfobacteriota bacterium]
MPEKREKRCLAVGLDGVSRGLVSEYMDMGLMPRVKEILSGGFTLHEMDASIPDVSSTSWASFLTGTNPGEHGIYGFMDLKPGAYSMYFPSYSHISAPSIWDILGGTAGGKKSTLANRYGDRFPDPLRSVVMNVPETYPAAPMNGILTAGFVCIDLEKGTYPASAYDYLKSIGYRSDVDSTKAVSDPDGFFEEVDFVLDRRVEAFEHFMVEDPWALFIAVITETDRLHHFFFDAAFDETHKYHGRFINFYKKLDDIIGTLFARFHDLTGGEGFFMTMSDHGFTELKKEVYINTLFQKEGLLHLDESRDYFEQIKAPTKAFAMEPARIYLNHEGKYPEGAVSSDDVAGVTQAVKRVLASLTFEGENVIKRIYENNELYSGQEADKGPDLVCLANDGFDLKSTFKKEEVFGNGRFTGMHTRHDAHSILPNRAAPDKRLHIESLAAIILDYFSS